MTSLAFSASAGNMYVYKDKGGQVLLNNADPSGEKVMGYAEKAYYALSGNAPERKSSVAIDENGQAYLTNVNPEGNFDKFTKKVKVTYYKDSEAYNSASDEDSTKSLDGNYLEAGIDMSTINRWRANAAESEAAAKKLAKKPNAAIGMTKSQVRNKTNWGEPKYINTTTNKYGTHEQWVYDDYQYLYFDNGKLTTIQQ